MPTFRNTLFHLHRQVVVDLPAYENGTDRVFRNVGIFNSDAGELPRRKHTTYRTRRKFEIKSIILGKLKDFNTHTHSACVYFAASV